MEMKNKRIKSKSIISNKEENLETIKLEQMRSINLEYYNIRQKCLINEFVAFSNKDANLLIESSETLVKNIINLLTKLKSLIQELFNKFLLYFKNTKDVIDNKIIKYLDPIKDKNIEDFTFNGFNFTLDKAPNIDINKLFIMGNKVSISSLKNKLSDSYISEIKSKLDEEHYSKMRGVILRANGMVTSSEFNDYIFKTFRNNQQKEQKIKFSQYTDVKKLINDVLSYKKTINDIKEEKDNTIRLYSDLINYFLNLNDLYYTKSSEEFINSPKHIKNNGKNQYEINKNGIKLNINKDLVNNLRKYIDLATSEARIIVNMITSVFTGKLEAARKKHAQDVVLLTKIIKSK